MNNLFTINSQTVRRVVFAMMAMLFVVASLPLLQLKHASADQVTSRSIEMSDSVASGGTVTTGVGSGTAVTYRVTFTPGSTSASQAGSLVIDFCNEDPILGDTCTRPSPTTGTPAIDPTGVSPIAGTVGGTGWTLTAANGQVKLADDGVSGHDIQPGVTQTFDLTGIVNPNTVGTFFARIYTYTDNAFNAGAYTGPTVLGSYEDYGGFALSTTPVITITARVQEQLTFCVTKAVIASVTSKDCSDPAISSSGNLPAITLGHGTPTPVLDPQTVDTSDGPTTGGGPLTGAGDLWTQLSTNATHGAIIRLHVGNTCGGLSTNGGTDGCPIPAVGATAAAIATGLSTGNAEFGLFVADSTIGLGSNGVGTITPDARYHNGSHVTIPSDLFFGFDITTSNDNVISTYGSKIASTTSPTYRVNNEYVFGTTVSPSTPAGIYTENMSMIATGTF